MIIDIHHHYVPKRYFDEIATLLPAEIEPVWKNGRLSARNRSTGHTYTPSVDPKYWHDVDTQLRCMDAAGIDHAVVSTATYQDWMTTAAARVINDGTAELIKCHPDRFSGMISVPPDGGEEMISEIKRAKNLGLCALNMTTTRGGRYPDSEQFRLFLKTAADLKIPVFVHPSWCGPLPGMDRWSLERSLGKPTDMALSIANLMYGGAFAELPHLRMCFGHLGGSLPIVLRRMFLGEPGYLSAPHYDYPALLKRLFVDTAPGMWQSHLEVEAAARIIGARQTLFGSDYPLGNPESVMIQSVDHVRQTSLSETEKAQIFSRNAIELFGLNYLGADAKVLGHAHVAGSDCC
ncbi:MAG: hydrolase [Bradyrhizobium sp.]|nr:hydrolase [Bradyrhizobium sp.]